MDNENGCPPGIPTYAEGPLRKVERGRHLLRQVWTLMARWASEHRVYGETLLRPDRRRIDIILRTETEPPLHEAAVLVGDALHNLRSSLDGLIWNLVSANQTAVQNPRHLYFPVVEKRSEWSKALKNLPLSSNAIDVIRSVQPFNYPDLGASPLWLLHRLNIQDKHRGFLVANSGLRWAELSGMTLGLDAGTELHHEAIPVDIERVDGTAIGFMELSRPVWEHAYAPGSVAASLTFKLALNEPGGFIFLNEAIVKFPLFTESLIRDVAACS